MLQMRQLKAKTRYGCFGHLVFFGLTAVHDARMAREDARPGRFLSHYAVDHGVRDSILLGGTHDYVRLPLYGRPQAGFGHEKGQRMGRQEKRQRALSAGLHPCARARRRTPENVKDQGQRDRSAGYHSALRYRRHAFHAGRHGRAGHRHCIQREPHRWLSRLR